MLVLWVHYMLVQNRVALLRLKKKAKYLSGVCAFQVFFIYLQNKLLTINFYKAMSQTIFIRPQTHRRN